jgi:hypothetical protein
MANALPLQPISPRDALTIADSPSLAFAYMCETPNRFVQQPLGINPKIRKLAQHILREQLFSYVLCPFGLFTTGVMTCFATTPAEMGRGIIGTAYFTVLRFFCKTQAQTHARALKKEFNNAILGV